MVPHPPDGLRRRGVPRLKSASEKKKCAQSPAPEKKKNAQMVSEEEKECPVSRVREEKECPVSHVREEDKCPGSKVRALSVRRTQNHLSARDLKALHQVP
jgi:hypothetical protein